MGSGASAAHRRSARSRSAGGTGAKRTASDVAASTARASSDRPSWMTTISPSNPGWRRRKESIRTRVPGTKRSVAAVARQTGFPDVTSPLPSCRFPAPVRGRGATNECRPPIRAIAAPRPPGRAAVERHALVPAPSRQQHPHAMLRGPALDGRLQPREPPARIHAVAPRHGEQFFGGDLEMVEQAQLLPGAHRVEDLVLRCAGRGRLAVARRQPGVGERRRPALAAQLARRQHHHRGRIQAAAQVRAHGVGAAQAVAHRPCVEVQEFLRIRIVGGPPRPRGPLRPPVPVQPRRRGPGHRQRVAGRKLAHHREERPGVAQRVAPDQPGGHGGFVEPVIDAGRGEHRLHGAGEDEAMRGFGVVEGPGADGVAGAEQGTGATIPHREGVIAEQMVRAVPAPARPGPCNQVRVVEAGAFGVRHPERVAECAAVVEATGLATAPSSRLC